MKIIKPILVLQKKKNKKNLTIWSAFHTMAISLFAKVVKQYFWQSYHKNNNIQLQSETFFKAKWEFNYIYIVSSKGKLLIKLSNKKPVYEKNWFAARASLKTYQKWSSLSIGKWLNCTFLETLSIREAAKKLFFSGPATKRGGG